MTTNFPQPARDALEQFPVAFQDDVSYTGATGAAWAPGRVNLIGEHTDYNDGFVLPIAVDRVAAFAGRARSDGIVRLWSTHFQEYAQFSLEGLPLTFEQQCNTFPGWARYVLAVATELTRTGVRLAGFDAVVGGDVPLGGGMSSSAALEVATAQACALFSGGQLDVLDKSALYGPAEATLTPMQVAALCQRAEHIASGLQSGILDQAASCLGRPGAAILLDCRSLAYRYLPFATPELSLVVIDTRVRRELATSAYNERRKQCEDATRILRDVMMQHERSMAQAICALRDITQEQFHRYGSYLPEVLRRRAGYVIAEDERVLQAVKLLEMGMIEEIGSLLWLSHAGLRDGYEVSCAELDILVEIAQQVPGVLGARMMGGGFGGCTINLVRTESVETLRQAVNQQYPDRTGLEAGFDICRAAGGPGNGWVSE
jgi:galactokinase